MVSKVTKPEGRLCACACTCVCKVDNQLFDVDKAIKFFFNILILPYVQKFLFGLRFEKHGLQSLCFCIVFYRPLETLRCTRMKEEDSHVNRQSLITFSDVLPQLNISRDLTYIQIARY